ncbi:hypothetical protein OIU84_005391 [Salix udensis]|uniref:Uncharacterized protein n=1 Tax=Salix udensis TaxID=889485 RepID=A0AAD6JWA7_9ROSI|nr:hypothetical protein OIU84_005391 [Salix udensis]
MAPLQPNFGVIASTNVGGGGNHGEKQQQQKHQLSQEKNLMGGVELVPSQAFAMSFASFNGSKTASNLNFSAMAQNPPILQSFPDMTWQGYQVVSAGQATQKKNHQMSEGKTGGSSTNPDDGKKSYVWKAIYSIPMAAHSSSTSQQQQLVQLQKQHVLQQPIGHSSVTTPQVGMLRSPPRFVESIYLMCSSRPVAPTVIRVSNLESANDGCGHFQGALQFALLLSLLTILQCNLVSFISCSNPKP